MDKKKKKEFDITVHYDIKGRKRYKRKLWGVFGIMILILLGCAAMFYFANVTWDPEAGFSPEAHPEQPYQIALIVIASLLSVAAMVCTFLYCYFDIVKFYRTQMAYQKTPKFKEAKAKALKQDLVKLPKSTIKWYKKLGYITGQEKSEILSRKKYGKKEKTAN